MAKAKSGNAIGGWAFLIGVVLAVVLGLLGQINPTMTWILVVIGLIVGLLNIADEETQPFLLSGAVLIIASALGADVVSAVSELQAVVNALLLIFVPATIVVAIKNVLKLARK